ncbi:hypothetical protein lbkm_1498 [Lachnospiraceae bacterium KM106-2]|nr:hypothetical protein lbkm_1498 [Lachnospiraceae bacterium KM106-2]
MKDYLNDNSIVTLLDTGNYHVSDYISFVENIKGWIDMFRRLQIPYYE